MRNQRIGRASLAIAAAFATVLTVGGATAQAATCSVPSVPHPTIQSAVSDPTCNPIVVAAGVYSENVTIARVVILKGAQAGANACGRVASESIVMPLNPATATMSLQAGSLGSIIDGFEFSGGAFPAGQGAIASFTGPIDGLQILNNRIRGFTAGSGVWLNDNGLNITASQNEVDGSSTSTLSGGGLFHLDTDNFDGFWFTNNCVVNGTMTTGFFVDGLRNVDAGSSTRPPMFIGNFIANNLTGANLGRGAWGDGPIGANTFSNNRSDGLQGGPKNSTISKNTFDSNGRHGLALTSFSNTNPNFSGPGMTAGAQADTVTQNCFTGNGFLQGGAGILFSSTQAVNTISSNVANQNNIFGNFIGAQYLGVETINAQSNWWGSPTGPFHPTNNPSGTGDTVVDNGPLPGGIDFSNWLTSPAGSTPCSPPPSGKVTGGGTINVAGGTGTFGFNAKQSGGVGSGHLNYINHFTGAHLNCTVTSVTTLTGTTAEFSGTCSPNSTSTATSFMVHAEDNAQPGKDADRFIITYGPPTVTEGGTIISGNIQIH